MPQAGVYVLPSLVSCALILASYIEARSPQGTASQSTYNGCRASLCEVAYLNSVDDFCLWAPQPALSTTRNAEHTLVAWCMKSTHGTRLIPDGTMSEAHLVITPEYVQISGAGKLTNINVPADGVASASGEGDRLHGLVFTRAYGQLEQIYDWTSFVSQERFCFRACKPSATTSTTCPPMHDICGCSEVVLANYDTGVFEDCIMDVVEAPSTLYQDILAAPLHCSARPASRCTTGDTIHNAQLAHARRAIAFTSGSTSSFTSSIAPTTTGTATSITFSSSPTSAFTATTLMNSSTPISSTTPTSTPYPYSHTHTHSHPHSHNSSSYSQSPSSITSPPGDPSTTSSASSPTSSTQSFTLTYSSSDPSPSGTPSSTFTPILTSTPTPTPTPTPSFPTSSDTTVSSLPSLFSSQPSSYQSYTPSPTTAPTSSLTSPPTLPFTSQSTDALTFTTSPSSSSFTVSLLPTFPNSQTQLGSQCPPPLRAVANAGSVVPSAPLLPLMLTIVTIVISTSVGILVL